MKTLLATLAILACLVVSANAQSFTSFTTITIQDTTGANADITADTAFAAINTGWWDYAVITTKLQKVGGSGTYCPIYMTSIDGLEWDSVRTDTLTADNQNVTFTLSRSEAIKRGSDGSTAAGASSVGLPLSRYFKVYIDEIAASTGSELWIQAFVRESRP